MTSRIPSLDSLCTANCGSFPSFVNARHERRRRGEGKEKREAAAASPPRITHECPSFPKMAESCLSRKFVTTWRQRAIFLQLISFHLLKRSRMSRRSNYYKGNHKRIFLRIYEVMVDKLTLVYKGAPLQTKKLFHPPNILANFNKMPRPVEWWVKSTCVYSKFRKLFVSEKAVEGHSVQRHRLSDVCHSHWRLMSVNDPSNRRYTTSYDTYLFVV